MVKTWKTWEYYQGEWTEIEDPLGDVENETREEAMERVGYSVYPLEAWGSIEYGSSVILYRDREGALPYLVTFCFGDNVPYNVCIDDVPSLMQWLKDYTPIFSQPCATNEHS